MTDFISKTKIATIKVLDEARVAVIGLHPDDYKKLYETFGIYAPNYIFNPQYKLRKWDGKLRYFSMAGATYFALLPEIVPALKKMGYKLTVVDKRQNWDTEIPKIDKHYLEAYDIELGPHQVEAINIIAEKGNGMLIAGTGAGKTYITAILCDLYESVCGLKVIVIVPTTDLIDQTITELRSLGLIVGEYSGSRKDTTPGVVVSTWQALQNTPKIMNLFSAVILDECHGATGKELQNLLIDAGAHIPVRIGMTGTLPKAEADLMAIRICMGDVLYEVKAHTLIERGWLAALKIKMYCLLENFTQKWTEFQRDYPEEASLMNEKKFTEGYLPDFDAETQYLRKVKLRNIFIADFIENIRSEGKGNTFVLVKSVPYGKALAKLIDGAVFVYGADKTAIRKQIYKTFEEGENLVVISTFQLASTGLNIKRIFNLVFVDAGKSFTKIIQAIGRGLRKAHDKDSVRVYDFYSNLKYSKRHAAQRKSFYKEQKYDHTVATVEYEKYYQDD